ncbi:HAD-like domain-containing protein [Leucosporidium creatinivorum]|uniref:HAD-like domain-containing protein n=1 Tax=Leucosporidium creatinivorum TaxID=106004 RepID=A0A1Y2FCV8_9BASI|nr:HAD-like domain-containing protein [Leucosporidium creatinivorum]
MTCLRALLIDLSGTLHVSDTATPGAAAAIRRLREAGIAIRYVSNTSKESKKSLLDKMKRMDLDVREEELFTSLSAVRSLVDARNLNPLYLLSPSSLSDFPPPSPSSPYSAVIVGLAPDRLSYTNGLNDAFRLLAGEEGPGKGKVQLIATHRATYVGAGDGKLSLGPGPFITALVEASGVKAEVVGKPTRAFFELALRSLEKDGITSKDWSSVGMVRLHSILSPISSRHRHRHRHRPPNPSSLGSRLPPTLGVDPLLPQIGDDWKQDTGLIARELGLRRYLVRTGKYREGDETRLAKEEGEGEGEVGPEWCGKNFEEAVEDVLR